MNSATLTHPLSDHAVPAPRVAPLVAVLPWLVIVFVASLVTLPLWEPGALAGHSAWYDLTRIAVFDAAIRAGDWFPAWSPDFYHGYGSPLFQFYAPLSYYFVEMPVLAGADYATALKLTQALALAASGLAMFRFAVPHVSRWAACAAAILYMVAPYRFVDLYVRHALAEHLAFVWLPLIALGTERLVSKRSRVGLLLAAGATAGLILTHNITAMIGLPFCVAAGWVLGARSFQFLPMLRACLPAVLGIGLAAFFWWPAMAGRALTHSTEALTGGYFDVHRHFAALSRLLIPGWGFGGSTEAEADTMSLQIGVLHLLVGAGAALIAVCGSGKCGRWIAVGVATMALAGVMCHAVTRPVWNAVPLLDYVQFPWRFLGFAVFGAAMCGAALVDRLGARQPRREAAIFAAMLIAAMAAYSPYCREAWYLAFDTKAEELVRVPSDLMRAGLTTGRLAPIASVLTPETVRRSGERGTSLDDFLPRDVREKPAEPPTAPIATTTGRVVEVAQFSPNDYRAAVSLPAPGIVELRQFWFPGWTATVNAHPVEVRPSGPSALVSCALPAGEHVVEFRYTSLPQRRTGLATTILSGIALAVAACFAKTTRTDG